MLLKNLDGVGDPTFILKIIIKITVNGKNKNEYLITNWNANTWKTYYELLVKLITSKHKEIFWRNKNYKKKWWNDTKKIK